MNIGSNNKNNNNDNLFISYKVHRHFLKVKTQIKISWYNSTRNATEFTQKDALVLKTYKIPVEGSVFWIKFNLEWIAHYGYEN